MLQELGYFKMRRMKCALIFTLTLLYPYLLFAQGRLPADLGPNGGLKVEAVTGSVEHVVCDSGCGSPPATPDNATFTFSTTNVSPIAFVVDDAAPHAVADGKSGSPRMSGNRVLYVDFTKNTTPAHTICDSGCGSPPATPDNSAFTASTTNITPVGGVFNDGLAAVTSGNQAAPRITTNRGLHINFRNNAGTEIGTAANPIQVTGANGTFILGAGAAAIGTVSLTGTLPAFAATPTFNVGTTNGLFLDATYTGRMPAGASPANGESNTNTALSRIGGFNFIYNGTTWDRWTGAVTGSGNFTVVNGGTFAVQNTANASTNVSQIAGTTTSVNTGTPDAGTIREVLADGLLECQIVSAASTNATSCKGSAGNFFGYDIYNTTTTVYYLRLYNTAAAPTCSSATGFIRSIPIPPASAAGGVGGAIRGLPIGVAYGTGIGYCITGGSSSTDNTNAAVGLFGTVMYR